MTPVDLVRLADLNLVESVRDQARWNAAGEIVESGGVVRAVSATRFPAGSLNCAMLTQPRATALRELLVELRAFYAARDRGFTMQIFGERDRELESACVAFGLTKLSDSPGMVLDAPVVERPLPAAVRVEVVTTSEAMGHLSQVEARAYATKGMPPQVAQKLFASPERMFEPHWHYVLAYLNDEPAAAAMANLSHGIGGVYWVGTVPEARGRGLGEIVARSVGNWAFDQGARAVVLQASEQGEPVYRRLGYRVFSRYPWYLATKPGP